MLQKIRQAVFFLLITVILVTSASPSTVLAAEACIISLNPAVIDKNTPEVTFTINSTTLPVGAGNKYWVTIVAPNVNNAQKRGQVFDSSGKMTVAFQNPTQGGQIGTHTLYIKPDGAPGLSNQNLSCNPKTFEVKDVAAQTSCTITMLTDPPLTPATPIKIKLSGLTPSAPSLTSPLGGYNVYLNGSHNNPTVSIGSSGEAEITILSNKGTESLEVISSIYTIEVKDRCGLGGIICTPKPQCRPYNFNIIAINRERDRPVCSISPTPSATTPTTSDPITVQMTNAAADVTYTSWLDQNYSRQIDSKKATSTERTINLNIGEGLAVGEHTAEIFNGNTLACPAVKFKVVEGAITPPNTQGCSISPASPNDKSKVFIKGTRLSPGNTYKSFLDGKQVVTKSTSSTQSTLNLDLGEKLARGSHKGEIQDVAGTIICTLNFEVKAGTGGTVIGPGATAGGTPCIGDEGAIMSDRVATAIGCIPTKPDKLAQELLKVASGLGGGVALLMMISGAFQMITSVGNPESVKKGQEKFSSAVMGLLFIIFSVLLMEIIGIDILDLPGFER